MRDIAKQIEHMRIVRSHQDSTTSGGSTITSGSTINTNSGSSGGSNSPTTGTYTYIKNREFKTNSICISTQKFSRIIWIFKVFSPYED